MGRVPSRAVVLIVLCGTTVSLAAPSASAGAEKEEMKGRVDVAL
jgi:hypothetical protein